MMKLAPLQLEHYFIKSLRFDLRAGFDEREALDEGVALPDFNVTANVTQDTDDPRRCRCELMIELLDDSDGKFPYTFVIVLVGVFLVSTKYPEDQVELLLKVNAPSILYSAGREIALNVSGRGGYPPFLLPSVSFAPSPDEVSQGQQGAARTTAASSKHSTAKKAAAKKARGTDAKKAAKK